MKTNYRVMLFEAPGTDVFTLNGNTNWGWATRTEEGDLIISRFVMKKLKYPIERVPEDYREIKSFLIDRKDITIDPKANSAVIRIQSKSQDPVFLLLIKQPSTPKSNMT